MEMRLTGAVSEVAADEVTPELVRGVHDDEAAGGRVDDKITGPSDGTDELSHETDRLDVGVKCAVDFFRPSAWNTVIAPGVFRGEWPLLQHQQIITAPPGAVAHTKTQSVPRYQVNGFNRDSPDESQTGINVRVFPALLQDRREVLIATSTSGNPNAWSRV